ncbi:MAG: flagellar basal body L-ring protein FlgH [Candidatus Hydrogenedentota bacterium]
MKKLCVLILLVAIAALPAMGDSLFNRDAEKSGTLIAEPTARFDVGDIINVMVRETVTASTESDTRTRKESDVESESDPEGNTFLVGDDPDYRGGMIGSDKLPNWEIESENEHRGQGQTRRTSELITTMTCEVKEVQENGNLMLAGEKRLSINREDTTFVVTGAVRPEDVTAGNTVQSNQMHNAVIEIKGKGPLWNNQRRGIVTKILDWFSPF